MSPAERQFWLRATRRASSLSPEINAAILRAFAILRDSMTDAELVRFVSSGQIERLLYEIFDQPTMDRAFIPVRARLRDQVDRNVKYFARDLPGGGLVGGVIGVSFNVLNPRVIDAIRALDTKVIQSLHADIRETVRAFIENGLRDGVNPRVVARDLRAVIGMSPTQEANAEKFATRLAEEGKLSAAQIEKSVAAYRRRAISLNAETNARTASLDAMKLGQRLAWDDAIDAGIVDRGSLTKTWRGVLDSRERDEHVAMEGETVPFDSPFSNGQMIPGDTEWNCRCTPIYRAA